MATVGEEYPKQQERLRGCLKQLEQLPPSSSWFMIAELKGILKASEDAIASGDIVAQLRAFKTMQEYELT